MIRRWIPLDKLEIYDDMHFKTEDGWDVDVEKDGNTKEEHRKGIEYIKGLMEEGAKIRPILVVEDGDGLYTRLDGFKRCIAHKERGEKFIEAFVCTPLEYSTGQKFKYLDGEMWAGKGGQMKEVYTSAVEGYDQEGAFDYAEQKFLYNSPNPHGLKIEVSESIHVHWEKYGRYRLGLGRRDFIQLAEGISKI